MLAAEGVAERERDLCLGPAIFICLLNWFVVANALCKQDMSNWMTLGARDNLKTH